MRKTRSDKKIVLTYGDIKEGKLRNFIKEAVAGDMIDNSDKVRNLIKALSAEDPGVERMWIIFLNAKNRIIATEEVFRGSISSSPVFPREIVKKIIHHNAFAFIMAHNHPSGDTGPSSEDNKITKTTYSAAMLVGCIMHDHIIVGEGTDTYYSYANSGMMNDFKKTFEKMF